MLQEAIAVSFKNSSWIGWQRTEPDSLRRCSYGVSAWANASSSDCWTAARSSTPNESLELKDLTCSSRSLIFSTEEDWDMVSTGKRKMCANAGHRHMELLRTTLPLSMLGTRNNTQASQNRCFDMQDVGLLTCATHRTPTASYLGKWAKRTQGIRGKGVESPRTYYQSLSSAKSLRGGWPPIHTRMGAAIYCSDDFPILQGLSHVWWRTWSRSLPISTYSSGHPTFISPHRECIMSCTHARVRVPKYAGDTLVVSGVRELVKLEVNMTRRHGSAEGHTTIYRPITLLYCNIQSSAGAFWKFRVEHYRTGNKFNCATKQTLTAITDIKYRH